MASSRIGFGMSSSLIYCVYSQAKERPQVFKVTAGKGFQITFSNGFTASVQFGYGNYCENKHDDTQQFHLGYTYTHDVKCANAEVAFWHKDQDGMDEPHGWIEPDAVAAFLLNVSQFEPPVRELPAAT